MKRFRDENGQTLIFTAFLMCCLFGFMAMAIDIGVLFRAQRKAQTAADAAAIAGGLEYFYHGASNAATVAQTAAANNLCSPNDSGYSACVTAVKNTYAQVNIPPGSGWHTASGYLEVVVRQPNPTIFMAAFGGLLPGGGSSSFNSMTVSARAVSGIVPGQSCLYVLDQTHAGSLSIKGGGTVQSPNCSITVDSSSSAALCITGNAADATFQTPGVFVVNAQAKAPPCNKLYPGASTTGSAAADPFANTLTFPDPTDTTNVCAPGNTVPATYTTISNAATSGSNLNVGALATYSMNTSTGGLSTESNHQYGITCFAGTNVTLNGVTFGPTDSNHLYLFEHGVVLSGNNTINGTVDLNSGMYCQGSLSGSNCSWNSAGGGPSLTINAPADVLATSTSYPWNGFAFVMPSSDFTSTCANSYGGPNYSNALTPLPNSCLQMQFGSQNGTLNGMIYAPGAAISLQDSGGSIGVAGIISDALFVNGNLTVTNYNYAHPDSPLAKVSLVE